VERGKRKTSTASKRHSKDAFTVRDDESPYPFNLVLRGLRFTPYTCSTCKYRASADELDITNRSLPTLKELGIVERYSICPAKEGPTRAVLLSPAADSERHRVTHSISGRTISACLVAGVTERRGNAAAVGSLMSEEELLRELYLKFYLEDHPALDDLDLECLVKAPLMLRRVQNAGGTYISSRTTRWDQDASGWERKARELSLKRQGPRRGFLSTDIAWAMDPRRGPKALAPNRFLAVPFDLSRSLQEQWKSVLPWLDDLADYAYRFTKTKRPRRRSNTYRDIYIYLSVKLAGKTLASVAHDVFPREHPKNGQEKVRLAVRGVHRVVKRDGIPIPSPVPLQE
jgi:hypothetical protein